MKTILLLALSLFSVACAHTPKEQNYNYVTHETLEKEFVTEKEKVCTHFKTSDKDFVSKSDYMTAYWRKVGNKFEKEDKKSQFVVGKSNLAAWHCGETSWAINTNLTEETPIGRDVPK